jgi:predicted dehydrogenase
MSKPIRVAVVGAGQFGSLHAHTLSRMPEAELTALVDANLEAAKRLRDSLGGSAIFSSLDELIEHRLADAVVIATRADTHLPLAEQAAKAGLSVLVEKPLANSAAEIREFQQRLAESRPLVMVDHLCLFHSLIVPLMARLRNTNFRALHFVRHRTEAIGCRFPDDHPIQLTMVHDLYVAAQMVNGEEPVAFHAAESRNAMGRADMSWAELRWADGRIATFQCHMMLPEGAPAEGWDRVEVFAQDFYSQTTTNPAPWVWADSHMRWPMNLEIHDSGGMLVALLRDFLRASVDGRIAKGCRVEDALQVQNWVEHLITSAS